MFSESYDIIFAANVIHVATNIVDSVSSLRQLLVPGGLCILLELTIESLSFLDLTFGLLPQWWNFSANDPIRKPFQHAIITSNQWIETFQLAKGFDSIEVVSTSNGDMSTIIAQKSTKQPILKDLSERFQQAWLIFSDNKQKFGWKIAEKLQDEFFEKNITIISYKNNDENSYNFNTYRVDNLSDIKKCIQDILLKYSLLNIIFAWTLDLENLNEDDEISLTHDKLKEQEELGCVSLMNIVQSISSLQPDIIPNIFVLTQDAQFDIENKLQFNYCQSSIIGFARSIIKEYATNRFRLIDIPLKFQSNIIDRLLNEFLHCNNSLYEEEVLLRYHEENNNIIRMISQFEKIIENKQEQEFENKIIIPNRDSNSIAFKLQISKTLFLSDLQWI
ncbi:unnamed protein product, partial [Rotaria sp. Silwood1]